MSRLGRVHPKALPIYERGAADPGMHIEYAALYFAPAPGLETFLAEQRDPSSANYHKWLTPEEFGDRFGLSANDIDKMISWLQSQGITVNDIARGRQWISFSGTALQMGRAFRTEIHRYQVDGREHFANSVPVSVPSAFAGVVSGVKGLDDFRLKPLYRRPMPALTADLNFGGGYHYLSPGDLAVIYNLSPLYAAGIDGAGQKIVVAGQTNFNLADIRAYRKMFGLPAADPQVVLYGPDPGFSTSDQTEASLDLEISGAIAKNATIIYVNSQNVDVSVQYAVDRNLAPVITFSYGICEEESDGLMRPVAQQANAQGITWMAASGDAAAAACDYTAETPQATKGAAVSYPASIPEITSVGGTEFSEDSPNAYWGAANGPNQPSALSYIPERVWNDSAIENAIAGGGGGASVFFQKPSWQSGPGVPNDGARDVPDVSFSASADHDGLIIFSSGSTGVVGGTSVSSPMFAGIVALLNQSLGSKNVAGLGNINPVLYRMAQTTTDVFHDITAGSNIVPCAQETPDCVNGQLGYAAGNGYDLAGGLGSLDAFNFVSEWNAGAASSTTLSANVAAIAPGDSVALTATVTGTGGVPSGSVTFVANDVSLGVATLNNGVAGLTVNGALIAAGNGIVGATYSGDTRFEQSAATLQLQLKTGTGSYVVPSISPNPVHQSGGEWDFEIVLSEKAGVATTLTACTIGRTDCLNLFRRTAIQPNGTLVTFALLDNISVPASLAFHFAGIDASGQTWSQDLTVPFLSDIPSISPAISLSGTPSAVQQNLSADPLCQWQQQLRVQELSGFAVSLTSFTVGGSNLSGGISQYFGTTRLAPWGTLTATVCLAGITPPVMKTYAIGGRAEDGTSVSATLSSTLTGPAASPETMSLSEPIVTIPASGTATVDLQFGGGSPNWTISVSPAANTKWLNVSALSGNGSTTLTLKTSASGLSNGVYMAALSITALNALPQSIALPIVFTVGSSPAISITGLANAASGAHAFAPGMLVAIYGNNLASTLQSAAIQPLPYSLAGTSATVNGVSAPLWFISPSQMNVQIPYETAGGTAVLGVNNNGQVASYAFPVTPTGPGIFAIPYSGAPGQTIALYMTGDGDVTPTLASGATPPAGTSLANYPKSRQPLTILVGGEQAKILFNGIVTGLIGITQVNFTIPPDAQAGPQPLVAKVGGVSSAPVKLTVTQ